MKNMRRKVVKQGLNALTVTLPKKWTRENNLQPGDEIDINIIENKITISSEKEIVKKKKEVNYSGTNTDQKLINSLLIQVYRDGYDQVKISYQDKDLTNFIKNSCKEMFIGLEVTEFSKNHCLVEMMIKEDKEKFWQFVKKMFFINKELSNLTIEIFQNNHKNKNLIQELVNQQMRYINYCKRLLYKELITDKNRLIWELCSSLNLLSRSMMHICEEKKALPQHITIMQSISTLIDLLYATQFKNKENIYKIRKSYKKIFNQEIIKLLKTGKSSIITFRLGEMIHQIALISKKVGFGQHK